MLYSAVPFCSGLLEEREKEIAENELIKRHLLDVQHHDEQMVNVLRQRDVHIMAHVFDAMHLVQQQKMLILKVLIKEQFSNDLFGFVTSFKNFYSNWSYRSIIRKIISSFILGIHTKQTFYTEFLYSIEWNGFHWIFNYLFIWKVPNFNTEINTWNISKIRD